MGFMDELDKQTNYSLTENGAVGYARTGRKLLDLNFAVSSLRNMSDEDVLIRFEQAYNEDRELALKWLFYARDVRGGLGERRLFRIAIKDIEKDLDERVLDWIAEYGRYDDMFALYDTRFCGAITAFIKKQLAEDCANMEKGLPVTLLAKWLPSENTSSKNTVMLAKKLRTNLGMDARAYRKLLATLRKYIDVIEVKMSAKKWGDIVYEAVPSRANLIYNDAFKRNDEIRRTEYLKKVARGEAKINAGTLFPHDILHKYSDRSDSDMGIEALWKALPNYLGDEQSTIVVCDGSGSMCSTVGKTSITCLEIAGALAIYFSERCKGQYKDKFITFSCTPQLVDLTGLLSLKLKWKKLRDHDEVSNTDIEKVFDLLLKTAVDAGMPQAEIPDILVISDMEFDSGTQCPGDTDRLMDSVAQKWAEAGYRLPKISYWNICGRTLTIPQIANESGLRLVSGFSPVVIRQILSPFKDPFDSLKDILLSERYAQVTIKK